MYFTLHLTNKKIQKLFLDTSELPIEQCTSYMKSHGVVSIRLKEMCLLDAAEPEPGSSDEGLEGLAVVRVLHC